MYLHQHSWRSCSRTQGLRGVATTGHGSCHLEAGRGRGGGGKEGGRREAGGGRERGRGKERRREAGGEGGRGRRGGGKREAETLSDRTSIQDCNTTLLQILTQ